MLDRILVFIAVVCGAIVIAPASSIQTIITAASVYPGTYPTGDYAYRGNLTVGSTVLPWYPNAPASDMFIGNMAGNAGVTGTTNTVIGYQAGNALTVPAFAANPQGNTLMGYQACRLCTTAREMTVIGAGAGAAFVGNGVGVEDGLSMFIGSLAGNVYTGTGAANTDMVCIGQKACANTTGGGFDIFLGNHSGTALLTATNSIIIGDVAVGSSALTATSSTDVIVGNDAFFSATGALIGNAAFGYGAGYSATVSQGNTLLGYQSGYSQTTVGFNTLVGYQAGYSNVSSAALVAVGFQAAFHNAGAGNTVMGYQAGFSNVGTNSTFFGSAAGGSLQITGGNSNSAFGYTACNDLTNGSFNMCLGNQSTAGSGNGAYRTVIGNGAVGKADHSITLGTASEIIIMPGAFLTPASSSAACVQGEVAFDASFVYTCVSANTWRRAATASF